MDPATHTTLCTILQDLKLGLQDLPLSFLTAVDPIEPNQDERTCISQIQSYVGTLDPLDLSTPWHSPITSTTTTQWWPKLPNPSTFTHWWTTAQQAIQRRAPHRVSHWTRVLMTDVALFWGVTTWIRVQDRNGAESAKEQDDEQQVKQAIRILDTALIVSGAPNRVVGEPSRADMELALVALLQHLLPPLDPPTHQRSSSSLPDPAHDPTHLLDPITLSSTPIPELPSLPPFFLAFSTTSEEQEEQEIKWWDQAWIVRG